MLSKLIGPCKSFHEIHLSKKPTQLSILQVFAIELVTFAVDFVPLAVEFGAFAVEFVGFALKFVMAIMTPKN